MIRDVASTLFYIVAIFVLGAIVLGLGVAVLDALGWIR